MHEHGAGRPDTAQALYQRVLAAAPQHPDGLHLLGVLQAQRGLHEEAAASIGRAIEAQPRGPGGLTLALQVNTGLGCPMLTGPAVGWNADVRQLTRAEHGSNAFETQPRHGTASPARHACDALPLIQRAT